MHYETAQSRCTTSNAALSSSSSSTKASSRINCSYLTSCLAQTLESCKQQQQQRRQPLFPTIHCFQPGDWRNRQNKTLCPVAHPTSNERAINYSMHSDADDRSRHWKGHWNGRVVSTVILHRWLAKGNCFSVRDLRWLYLNSMHTSGNWPFNLQSGQSITN